jgi:ATP-binding cassette subfamily B protein
LPIVGENGAGKTTLVKLLAKMYEPRAGTIFVDDTPLSRVRAEAWRSRLAGAFQDFFRFELKARQTIGVGDVPRLEEAPAVMAAVGVPVRTKSSSNSRPVWRHSLDRRGQAASMCRSGQWQKLALARGFMRDEPIVLVLDEPTAALDAETEHALFERYAAATRGGGATRAANGRITILVSHRFSTVRMADLIVVLDGAKVVEVGSHEELMAKRGQYSELYSIQAAAYR